MARRMPRWEEIKPLVKIRPPGVGPEARLAAAADIWDLRRIAKRRTPRAPFDYTDGAAEEEIALRRSRQAYRNIQFVPNVLRDVSEVDASTTLLGTSTTMPLALAPTGFTRMMQHEGETAVARAAERACAQSETRHNACYNLAAFHALRNDIPRTEASLTYAPNAIKGVIVSFAGEAVIKFPAMVPRLRITICATFCSDSRSTGLA